MAGLHNWASLWALLHKLFWFHEVLGCASTPGGDIDWTPHSGGDTDKASQSEEIIGCILLFFWARILVWFIWSGGASSCIMKMGGLEAVKMHYGWMVSLSKLSHQMGLLAMFCNWAGSLAGLLV